MIEFVLQEPLLVPVIVLGVGTLIYGVTCFLVKGCPRTPKE